MDPQQKHTMSRGFEWAPIIEVWASQKLVWVATSQTLS
jgi:hypothetical protein